MITIHKTHTISDPFCRFPKTISEDSSISWKAKGILCYLLGKPDGWKTRVSDIAKHGADGEDAIRAALKELRKAGYVKLTRITEKGRVVEWKWEISDSPIFFANPDAEKSGAMFPDAEKAALENPHTNKKEVSENELKKNEDKKIDLSAKQPKAPSVITNDEFSKIPFPDTIEGIYEVIMRDPRYNGDRIALHNAVHSMYSSKGKTRGRPFLDWISALFARADKIDSDVTAKKARKL